MQNLPRILIAFASLLDVEKEKENNNRKNMLVSERK